MLSPTSAKHVVVVPIYISSLYVDNTMFSNVLCNSNVRHLNKVN